MNAGQFGRTYSRKGEDEEEEGKAVQIPRYRWVMHAAVMFGREFCYAMETALVTPVLLQIGLPEQYYSLTWFLSPILGLLLTPLIGSASDRCTLRWGRRRPFILALCTGVLIGVALFLNGSLIGKTDPNTKQQPIGIVLTVVGVVVLDFCADASEGPIRAYLLDVADTDENLYCAFSGFPGLGGAVGYMLGGLDWTGTALGRAFKSQEQVLFLFAGVIFIISVTLHMLSIPERTFSSANQLKDGEDDESTSQLSVKLGTTVKLLWLSMFKANCHSFYFPVLQMPKQLWRLCVCHLLTWFSIIAEAVFYTDFMGQVIFRGNPKAPGNSTELQDYHRGVQMGCWGLVVYAATAAVCSGKTPTLFFILRELTSLLHCVFLSLGTAIMAIFPNVYIAMVMISTMGIISMSISYCPYALLGQYHEIKEYINHSPANTRRGFGIDCAILTCQVYISQILVASALGSVVEAVDSVRVIPVVASGGSFLGFLTACFLVIYPDTEHSSSVDY
uniref:Solute carrier family 45 member 4 n=1 Tax=Xiphophorus maculatus TaxID=8083 RepID=M4AJ52_XIPMA